MHFVKSFAPAWCTLIFLVHFVQPFAPATEDIFAPFVEKVSVGKPPTPTFSFIGMSRTQRADKLLLAEAITEK